MALNTEPYILAALNAAHRVELKGTATQKEAVTEVIAALVTDISGHCHETGKPPTSSGTCGCVPCRAWRSERAEKRAVAAEATAIQVAAEQARLEAQIVSLEGDVAAAIAEIDSRAALERRMTSNLEDSGRNAQSLAQALQQERQRALVAETFASELQRELAALHTRLEVLQELVDKADAFAINWKTITLPA